MTRPPGPPAQPAHPFSPAGRVDPYPAYDWLRAHEPVHRDPMTGMWLVTGYADCVALLKDPAFSAAAGQRERSRDDDLPVSMLTTDGADHARLRAPGSLLLGTGALASVADGIAADTDALLDRAAGHGVLADAVEELGVPLATAVLARLIGLGADQHGTLAELARAASVNLDPLAPPHVARLGRAAMGELTRFLDAHIDTLGHPEPGGSPEAGGTQGSPLARFAADPRLSRREMLGVLGLAVVGGWQPLAEAVGNALYWLLPRPDVREALRAGGREAAETAMDELLRLEAPIPFTARVTVRDAELPGGRVPAGQRVLAVLAAANRDPAVFADPGALVWDRSPNPHLAFGGGPHFCLAARLVKQSGALLLGRIVRRFPEAALSGAEPRWAATLIPRRLTGLGVDLGACAPRRTGSGPAESARASGRESCTEAEAAHA
ncbi:Cytochrome P450 [Streptomyces sp. 1222.5]|uniref:cytochrome P450 n=1 Tax=unclassified Streptomyces TaxID=2593676 RepID=UPI0008992D6F|nr:MULTISPECIES: cytochrome P450 [unclassified Streptomyces]PKW09362.1 cytochrome P450 [Streptomyces sp. 5112.2]SEC37287.1 Cytochrome P450 [Streptomyces sp. 1222.5]